MPHSEICEQESRESLFASIRRYRSDGAEYWLARELMPVLGYKTWESFARTIGRAVTSCKNTTDDIREHFRSVTKKSKGRDFQDYELSRYACYLTAMNGDPEKEEISLAQAYFAIKTREAEAVIPFQSDRLRELELLVELQKAETKKTLAEQNLLNIRHLIVSTCPEPVQQKILGYAEITKIEYRDRIVRDSVVINDGSTINKTDICRRYSLLTRNGKPDYKRLNTLLDRLNLPQSAWEETDVVQTNRELKRDYLSELDRALYTADERQLWTGE